MKKYLFVIACVSLLNGGLFAQTSSDNNSTSSGANSSSDTKANEPSGASTPSSSENPSATSGSTLNEPSGASTASQPAGVITIQGNVSSSAEKQEIERQLRQISGVTDVKNKLHVSPSSSTQPGASPSQP